MESAREVWSALSVVKSFHEGTKAEVRVGGSFSDSFEVRNGLYQGWL